MTIDEAIENLKYDIEIDMYIRDIAPQLAELLEELKSYRQYIDLTEIPEQYKLGFQDGIIAGYNKAIDNFAEKLKRENKETIPTHSGYCRMSFDEVVDEIAEQLKGGGENESK